MECELVSTTDNSMMGWTKTGCPVECWFFKNDTSMLKLRLDIIKGVGNVRLLAKSKKRGQAMRKVKELDEGKLAYLNFQNV